MKHRLNRFLALLLSFIMAMSLLPTQAFAGGWWGDIGKTGNYKPNTSATGLSFISNGTSGLRVTVAFIPGNGPLTVSRAEKGYVAGRPLDVLIPGNMGYNDGRANLSKEDVNSWLNSNIFNAQIWPYAHNSIYGTDEEYAFKVSRDKYANTSVTIDDLKISNFPKVVAYNQCTGSDKDLLTYLLSGDKATPELNKILSKYIEISNKYNSNVFGEEFSAEDFEKGEFQGGAGEFYVFLENVWLAKGGSKEVWALTLREIMAYMYPGPTTPKGSFWYDQSSPILGMATGLHIKQDYPAFGLHHYTSDQSSVRNLDLKSSGLGILKVTSDYNPTQAIGSHINVFLNSSGVESQGIEYLKQEGPTMSLAEFSSMLVQAVVQNKDETIIQTDQYYCAVEKEFRRIGDGKSLQVGSMTVCAEHPYVGSCVSAEGAHYVLVDQLDDKGDCKLHPKGTGYGQVQEFATMDSHIPISQRTNIAKLLDEELTSDNIKDRIATGASSAKTIIEQTLASKTSGGTIPADTAVALEQAVMAALSNADVREEVVNQLGNILSSYGTSSVSALDGDKKNIIIDSGIQAKIYGVLKAWSEETGTPLEKLGIVDIDESLLTSDKRYDGLYTKTAKNLGTIPKSELFNYDQVGILRTDLPYLVSDTNAATFKVPLISDSIILDITKYSDNGADSNFVRMRKGVVKDYVTDLLNKIGNIINDIDISNSSKSVKEIENEVIRKVDEAIWSYLGWGPLEAGRKTALESIKKAMAENPNITILDSVVFSHENSISGPFTINDVAKMTPTMMFELLSSTELKDVVGAVNEVEALKMLNAITLPFGFQFNSIKEFTSTYNGFGYLQSHLVGIIGKDTNMVYGNYNVKDKDYTVKAVYSSAITQVIQDAMKLIRYGQSELDIASTQMGDGKFISEPLNNAFYYEADVRDWALSRILTHAGQNGVESYERKIEQVLNNNNLTSLMAMPSAGTYSFIENATKEDIHDEIEELTLSRLNQVLYAPVEVEDGAGSFSEYRLKGNYGVSYTLWAEAIPIDLRIVGTDGQSEINTVTYNWGSAVPNYQNKVIIPPYVTTEVNGQPVQFDIKYFAFKPAEAEFESFYTEMAKGWVVGENTTSRSVVVDPSVNGGTVIQDARLSNADDDYKFLMDDTYFFSVSSKDQELTVPSAQAPESGKGRVELILVIGSSDPIKQYNIVDKLDGKTTVTEVVPKITNNEVILDNKQQGAFLVEWETSDEDTNPSKWSEIPATSIDKGTEEKIPLDNTKKPSVIYVHYVEEETRSAGSGDLTEKRITGAKKLGDMSAEGLLPVEYDWDPSYHGHPTLTGIAWILRTDAKENWARWYIINLIEEQINSGNVVADTKTGIFAPKFDANRDTKTMGMAASGGRENIYTQYYLNLFRDKDKPTVASYANNGNPVSSLGITSGKIPSAPRLDGTTYSGQIPLRIGQDSLKYGVSGGLTEVHLQHKCYDETEYTKNGWGVNFAQYDLAATVASYKGEVNTGADKSTPNATSGTFGIKTSTGAAITAANATGTSFHNAAAYKFYPYVEMIAESWTDRLELNQEKVNVLGGHESTMGVNDYVDIGYLSKPAQGNSTGLILESTQWSAHQQAVKNYGKDVVLPGGAIYSLKTPAGSETNVAVSMWLNMLDDDTIKNAATNNPTAYSQTTQLSAADSFLAQVRESLDRFDVVQHLADGKYTTPATVLGANKHVIVGMAGKTPLLDNQVMTDDAKYFLTRNTAIGSTKANEADLDILNTDQHKTYYAVWSDVNGNVHVGRGTSMQAASSSSSVVSQITKTQGIADLANTDELRELDAKTKLLTNYMASIDRNKGNDPDFGGTWYNEAWRPAYVCRYDTIYTIGFNTPTARTTAVDTHLEPPRADRASLFTDVNSSVFMVNAKTSAHPDKESGYVGTFKGADLAIANVTNMYVSKVFYIPNASVTDIVNY